jgi:hypothetical protein
LKRLALLLSLGLTALPMTLTAPPAHAATFAVVFTGTAHLPKFPCPAGCNGTFSGTANGTPKGAMTATYHYVEPQTTCPAQGTASGSGSIGGKPFTFKWTRVGLTAVITLKVSGTSGAATAVFVPSNSACNGAARTATVAGAGAG